MSKVKEFLAQEDTALTWEQFMEILKDDAIYRVTSVDNDLINLHMSHCTIQTEDYCLALDTPNAGVEFYQDNIETIYKTADTGILGGDCYRIKFNNGAPDIMIEPEAECH